MKITSGTISTINSLKDYGNTLTYIVDLSKLDYEIKVENNGMMLTLKEKESNLDSLFNK